MLLHVEDASRDRRATSRESCCRWRPARRAQRSPGRRSVCRRRRRPAPARRELCRDLPDSALPAGRSFRAPSKLPLARARSARSTSISLRWLLRTSSGVPLWRKGTVAAIFCCSVDIDIVQPIGIGLVEADLVAFKDHQLVIKIAGQDEALAGGVPGKLLLGLLRTFAARRASVPRWP